MKRYRHDFLSLEAVIKLIDNFAKQVDLSLYELRVNHGQYRVIGKEWFEGQLLRSEWTLNDIDDLPEIEIKGVKIVPSRSLSGTWKWSQKGED